MSYDADLSTQDAAVGPPVGTHLRQLAHFVLLREIGVGGMSIVHEAFDMKLERKVAIKLVTPRGSNTRTHMRVLREAQAQARLTHPNVVTVYEVGTLPDGGLFIAMELVKGPTLRTWRQSGTRSWQDIASIYAQAGEGLAAAHRVGIVHRDFKPDNVLIGEDGRARVADFGLAFAAEASSTVPASRTVDPEAPTDDATPAHSDEPAPIVDNPASPAATVTAEAITPTAAKPAQANIGTGATVATSEPPGISSPAKSHSIAGTPGYMAPELLAGKGVDGRADQFAFCVALYEALHGKRPTGEPGFSRGERPERRPSSPDAYPAWLWDLMMRGLSHEAADRFPSMDALLAELTRKRERVLSKVTSAIVVGLVTAIALFAIFHTPQPEVCPPATAELNGIWDDATKQHVQSALLGTKKPFAPKVWESVAATLDRYKGSWLDAQHAACQATQVQHSQSTELMDRRIECLKARKRSFAAATSVLLGRPVDAIANADEILGTLDDIALCADTQVLLRDLNDPAVKRAAAAAARPEAVEARKHLANATALIAVADADSAAPEVAKASELVKHLDAEQLLAEIDYTDGRVKLTKGDVGAATAMFDKAITGAIASRHDELTVDIYLMLALSVAERQARRADIEAWLAAGDAWMQRLGHEQDPRRIGLIHARGNAQRSADPHASLQTLSSAITTAEEQWGKGDPRLVSLLLDRASTNVQLNDAQAALRDDQRALALAIQTWGQDAPATARAHRALGSLYAEQLGEPKKGIPEITEALEAFRARSDDSLEVGITEEMLSSALQFTSEYRAALRHAEHALDIFNKRLSPGDTRVGDGWQAIGVLRAELKDFPGALAAEQEAYRILTAVLGAESPEVGLLLSNIGEALLALGRTQEARDNFERARVLLNKRPDDQAYALKGLGLAELMLSHPREALGPLEQALAIRNHPATAGEPQELPQIQWGLARTLRALNKDPPRTRQLAEAALAAFHALGETATEQEISHWLR